MNKSSFWKTMSDEDKKAARDLAAEETARLKTSVSGLNILDQIMTDAEKAAPEPNFAQP